MNENERTETESGTGTQQSGNFSAETLATVLSSLGLKGPLFEMATKHLGPAIGQKMENLDPKDVMERAQMLASTGKDRMKDAARMNPKMFYSGLAAAVVGVSLMTAAIRRGEGDDVETDITTQDDFNRPNLSGV